MLHLFTSLAETTSHFLTLLSQYLAGFKQAARLLIEARQLDQPTDELEANLRRDLLAYSWSVQSRPFLRVAAASAPPQQALELHLRLSVVELLAALRLNRMAEPVPAPQPDALAPTPQQLQRLAAAEARLFHCYGAIPLN